MTRGRVDARPASEPVHGVERRLDVRIPVRDPLALSSNLWLPVPRADAPEDRYPAVLEMIPYRKDDWGREQRRGARMTAPGSVARRATR